MEFVKMKYFLNVIVIIAVVIFEGCHKDDPASPKVFSPKSGNWTGEDISFTVGDMPLTVSNLVFSYSGFASGTVCSYAYETTSKLSADIQIASNSFNNSSSSYTVKGNFSDNQNAEITISWNIFDRYCMASYSGSRTYTASYSDSANTALNKKSANADDSELIELDEEGFNSLIKKDYTPK